jgi:beta-glucosidase
LDRLQISKLDIFCLHRDNPDIPVDEFIDALAEIKNEGLVNLIGASHADDVILIVGTNSDWETEGNDRADFNLPANQNKLIEAILEVNQNTVVVINTGSPIHMPWEKKAKAIIQTWFAGQEFGNALVDILSGEVNPSGKLPTTFPVKIEDTPAYKNYPGKNLQMNYDEKLLVGHRWYEANSMKPLFCFGHGLSFTSFK